MPDSLESRVTECERMLQKYRSECERSHLDLSKGIDRIMRAAMGDQDLGTIGFIELHKQQHDDLMSRMDLITTAQDESRKHRALVVALPDDVASLRLLVTQMQQDRHDDQIRMDAYKRSARWLWVAIGAVATIGPTVTWLVGKLLA